MRNMKYLKKKLQKINEKYEKKKNQKKKNIYEI